MSAEVAAELYNSTHSREMLGVTVVSRSMPCGLYMISLMITSARTFANPPTPPATNTAQKHRRSINQPTASLGELFRSEQGLLNRRNPLLPTKSGPGRWLRHNTA